MSVSNFGFSFIYLCGVLLTSATPALANQALHSKADTGKAHHSNWRTTQTNTDYKHVETSWHRNLAAQGQTACTNTQGYASQNGALLQGTTTGVPLVGSNTAPGNLSLRNMGKRTLPPTRMESFVRGSSNAEASYGDEGVFLPPFMGFTARHRIEAGMNWPDLTTGHRANVDSAWDFPN